MNYMSIHYETATATFIQFIIGAGLSFVTGVVSIISGCKGSGGVDCATNIFVSLILIILTIAAFGFLLAVGYVAQDRRSSRLALLLIACEVFAVVIFLFDAKHALGVVDKITNGLSALIALWVAYIAWRLYRAKGARIVKSRTRHHTS